MASKEKLLREYVRNVLNEENGGDGGDFGGGMGMGMYGMSFASQQDMYKGLIQPFVDIFKTAAGGMKQVSLKGQKLLRTTFETVATTLIPVLSSDYKGIFDKYEEKLNKVREQYKEVYDANWTALTDSDVMLAAFCYAPSAMITQWALRKAPIPVMNTIDALSGGHFTEYFDKVENMLKLGGDTVEPLQRTGAPGEEKSLVWSKGGGRGGMGGGGGWGYGGDGGFGGGGEAAWHAGPLLREKKKKKKQEKQPDIVDLVMKPKIMQAVENSQITRSMQKQAQAMVHGVLEDVYDKAQGVLKAQNLEQLQKVMGKNVPEVQQVLKLPQEERAAAEQQLLKTVKTAAKNVYVQGLSDHIKIAVKSGVPQDHPYIAAYAMALNKIKAL